MGQVVKKLSENRTRYVWYPGEKKDWVRAVWAVALGAAAYGVLELGTHRTLLAVTVGISLTVGMAGFNLGRRDFRGARDFPEPGPKGSRRAAVVHAGHAAWRGLVQGIGGATAALLIANLAAAGFVANWLLPAVPAVAGALAHQAGALYERLGRTARPADLPPVPGSDATTVPLRPGSDATTVPAPPPAPRTRDWIGSYGVDAATAADAGSSHPPTSTGQPDPTLDDR
ncbi:hypothetical protein GCM10023322_17520 [Rugosimonospora acidiphila]|uniref:Uncharacterized protein n=1 Tax=Rugosimonospora acidiphila TaxID=556531 RepID=A0ABP9RNQ9_9ACTN